MDPTAEMIEAGAQAYCKWIGQLPAHLMPKAGEMIVWNEALAAAYRAMRQLEQRGRYACPECGGYGVVD